MCWKCWNFVFSDTGWFYLPQCIQCSAHIINLTAHTLTTHFDSAPKRLAMHTKSKGPQPFPGDVSTNGSINSSDDEDGEPDAGNDFDTENIYPDTAGLKDWVDDLEMMHADDLKSFAMRTTSVRHVLTKVCFNGVFFVFTTDYAFIFIHRFAS
jgi:hypothetical protein